MKIGVKVLIGFLVLAIISMGFYIVYDKSMKDKSKQINNQDKHDGNEYNDYNDVEYDGDKPNLDVSYSVDKTLVSKYLVKLDNSLLYNPSGDVTVQKGVDLFGSGKKGDLYSYDKTYYSSNGDSNLLFSNTNLNSLGDEFKISTAFYSRFGGDNKNYKKSYTSSEIREIFEAFFGPDIKYTDTSFGLASEYYFKYEKGSYTFYNADGDNGSDEYGVRPFIYNTIQTSDKIEIYASKVWTEYTSNVKWFKENVKNFYINFNVDSWKLSGFNLSLNYANIIEVNDGFYLSAKDNFYEYLNKFENYKYTFKKATNGEFYYYSTEKIN